MVKPQRTTKTSKIKKIATKDKSYDVDYHQSAYEKSRRDGLDRKYKGVSGFSSYGRRKIIT